MTTVLLAAVTRIRELKLTVVVKLLLDLKYYDEAGRVKPGSALWWVVAFLCRSLLIFLLSLAVRQDGDMLLRLFYPQDKYLYMGLAIGLPALLSYMLIAFREKLANKAQYWPFHLIKYLLFASCLMDFVFQCYLAKLHYWQFSWAVALVLITDIGVGFFIIRDRHLRVFIADWLRRDKSAIKTIAPG